MLFKFPRLRRMLRATSYYLSTPRQNKMFRPAYNDSTVLNDHLGGQKGKTAVKMFDLSLQTLKRKLRFYIER